MVNKKGRFQGCLLGGAIGDALGYPVEFMDINEIQRKFGTDGITDLLCDKTQGKAIVSDDTQMTIFTAEGILWADARGQNRDICSYPSCVFYSYQRWLYTQMGKVASKEYEWVLEDDTRLKYKSCLQDIKALFHRRAPGNTCLSALSISTHQNYGTIEQHINNSKGCGGVMSVAPDTQIISRREDTAIVNCNSQHFTLVKKGDKWLVDSVLCKSELNQKIDAYIQAQVPELLINTQTLTIGDAPEYPNKNNPSKKYYRVIFHFEDLTDSPYWSYFSVSEDIGDIMVLDYLKERDFRYLSLEEWRSMLANKSILDYVNTQNIRTIPLTYLICDDIDLDGNFEYVLMGKNNNAYESEKRTVNFIP